VKRFLSLFAFVFAASALVTAVPTSASAAAAPARQSAAIVNPAAVHGCPSGDFCIFSEPNFAGTEMDFTRCQQFHFIPFVGTGSFVNNQDDGIRAAFYNSDKTFLNFTAPAYTQNASKNWTNVFYVVNC